MKNPVYLKPNVVIEPLVDNWYAWSHLIPPATTAMNITGRHLKIMNSYIQAPHIHAAAVKNPKMLGGPFMNYVEPRSEEIQSLVNETHMKRKHLIEFSAAVKELDELLRKHGKGYSLEPLYAQVPEILKGYVELTYDLNNNPSFRFFERLLYKSEFYDDSNQSIAMWLTNNDERPFVLSTARLRQADVLHFNIPFKEPIIDVMSQLKSTPGNYNDIKQLLNIKESEDALFKTFFTEEPPAPYQQYTGDKIRMRYFGHACILIETKDISILVDPVISYYGYQSDVSRFSYCDLPEKIDYILITHNHQDHVLFETMLYLRHKTRNIIVPRSGIGELQDPSLKLMFNMIGFNNVTEIEEMETIQFSDCKITGVPFIGEHADLDIKTKMCYSVQIASFSMMFMADSCNVESKLYQHISKQIDPIDVIFLGMECDGAPLTWVYGPLLTAELARDKDNSRRLSGSNYERGKALVDIFNPKELYVYAMGQEPWLEFISSIKYTDESNPIVASNKLINYCKEKGISAERLFGEKELFYDK